MTDTMLHVLAFSEKLSSTTKEAKDERSHLAVVACGARLEETLNMLKSAVLFSRKPIYFYIFAEDDLHDGFRIAVSVFPDSREASDVDAPSEAGTLLVSQ